MTDDIKMPERVFLVGKTKEGIVANDPTDSGDECRIAPCVFVERQDAISFAAEKGEGFSVLEITRTDLFDYLREWVENKVTPDGFIWLIEGDDITGFDPLASPRIESDDQCKYCAEDLAEAETETLEQTFEGRTRQGRLVPAQIDILFKRCPVCGQASCVGMRLPLDPDAPFNPRQLLNRGDTHNG